MELVYFWGKEYGIISKVEMSFNPKFTFYYSEKSHQLSYVEHKNEINVFSYSYANILNINAIVGENGQGKTTFIHYLIDAFNIELSRGAGNVELQYIIVLWDGYKFHIYDNVMGNIKLEGKLQCLSKIYPKEVSTSSRPNIPMCLVYYTNAFSFSEYREGIVKTVDSRIYNMSLSNILHQGINDSMGMFDQIKYAQHIVTKRQVAAWSAWDKRKGGQKQARLHLRIIANGQNYDVVKKFISNNLRKEEKSIKDKLLSVCLDVYQNKYPGRSVVVYQGVFYSLIQWMLLDATFKSEKKGNLIDSFIEKWNKLWNSKEQQKSMKKFIMENVQVLFDAMNENSDIYVDYGSFENGYENLITYLLNENISEYNNMVFSIKSDNAAEFYNNYMMAMGNIHEFISFDWGMSTGEYARFDLFSCLLELSEKANNLDCNNKLRGDSLLFVLDEIDLYLHPRWQQNFLGELLEDLKGLFLYKKIQIIFTTHSPIFLSDIPSQHVFYFTRDTETNKLYISKPHGRTFAANIYNLYKDSFLLNKSFVQTGSFALKIIKEIYSDWKRLCKTEVAVRDDKILSKINEQSKIVDLIGEELVRNALRRLYRGLADIVGEKSSELTLYEMTIRDYLNSSLEEQNKLQEKINESERI